MQLGMIGLGRMGANMVLRLIRAGHECVGFDVSPEAVATMTGDGMTGSSSLEAFVDALAAPRHVWMMVPAAFVDGTVDKLAPLLEPRRHDHRRRQLLVSRRHRPGRATGAETAGSTTSTSV